MQDWWTFPRIDNFGTKDPQGNYWKPDTNVQVPGNYPIANILPGTVTSVQQTSWGQSVVTVKLDTPVNSLATHTFYEHLSNTAVVQGQHIRAGDLVGYNNPPGMVPLGFGFYSGDVYGSGPEWNVAQQDLAPGGAGLLNPTSFLNKFAGSAGSTQKSGQPLPTPTGGCVAPQPIIGSPGSLAAVYNPLDMAGFGACMLWQQMQGSVAGWGIKIGLFALALVLVILGGVILIHPDPQAAIKDVAKGAVLA